VLVIARLIWGDIRRRPVESVLLVVMIAATATTLSLGLGLRHVGESPFARTRAATRGPDLAIEVQPPAGGHEVPARAFAQLLHGPGVAASAGPFPLAFVHLAAAGIDVPVDAEARTARPTPVNQPLLTAGHWVQPGGVVIEQGLADTLGLRVGDRVRLGSHRFRVAGIALQTEQPFYPACTPGLVWVTPAGAAGLATRSNPLGSVLDLKLKDPGAGAAFGSSPAGRAFGSGINAEAVVLQPWQEIRHQDYNIVSIDQQTLLVGSSLLALLAIASIAVVVGGRMSEQTRRVGLLKAVGATPRLVAAVLLAENLLLALAGAVAGLITGWLLLPSFADPGQGLLGAPPSPPLTLSVISEVTLSAVAVAVAATIAPAVRGARTSTLAALSDPVRPPRRGRLLIAISARLPVPLLLGLRLVSRRPRRTVLTAASLTLAVMMVVAAITLRYELDIKEQTHAPVGLFTSSAIGGRVTHLVFILGAVLVVLAGLNAVFTTWATVIDAERPTALARALGATPRQIGAALTTAQLVPGLIAACIGIPAGLALYEIAGGHVAKANPPALLLLAVIPCTLLAIAALTVVPARAGARRAVAEVLRSE
jgi:putative ABC transport system permease protein